MSHLHEFTFSVTDTDKVERVIVVSFDDHCFTRDPSGSDDAAPKYPGCSRKDGRFCVDRYGMSKHLRAHIEEASKGKVWNSTSDHYAIVTVEVGGKERSYGIVFSLDRVRGVEGVDLHMRIRTAHPRDNAPLVTFGHIRFAHLVKLRMQGDRPRKQFGHHRRKPGK